MLPDARYHVFAYGTLRPGGRYHEEFCRGIPSLPAFVRGRLYHLKPGYPALTFGDAWIRGDILSFEASPLLERMDALEDYDPAGAPEANLYLREPIDAFDVNKLLIGRVETYRMPFQKIKEMEGHPIEGGDWLRWAGNRSSP